jgi:ABC-type lipoprotein release transport system permease subunit
VDIVNRRRQIGILKSMGLSMNSIIFSYILKGLLYGILGIIFALIIMKLIIIPYMKIDMPMATVTLFVKQSALIASILFFTVATFIGSFTPA